MKKILLLLTIAIIVLNSCHKDKGASPVNGTSAGYKIEIIKGGSQSDTLGNLLKDSVIAKVTYNGNIVKNVFVFFETSGCDGNNDTTQVPIYSKGIAGYAWRLNGVTGTQTLKIILLDSLDVIRDSVKVTATGIMPTHGWYRSSCTPIFNPIPNSFCKLKSGRLIVSFNAFNSIYYSDDNALTWHPIKTFPAGAITIDKLIATPTDEIFAATQNNGFYYSPDGGQTWDARSTGITDMRYFTDMNYTSSGRLIYTTELGYVYLSTDKGVSWKQIQTGLTSTDGYIYPSEQTNGDLYIVDNVGNLFKSVNGGAQWNRVVLSFTSLVQSIFIDINGDMYIGADNGTAELYRSTDGGNNWSLLYTALPIPGVYREIQTMSNLNGTYYFYTYGNGLISTTNFNTFININPTLTETSRTYITTTANNLVIGTQFNGVYYHLP